jgi:hypothetical protein
MQMEHLTRKYETAMERLAMKSEWFAARGLQRQADRFLARQETLTAKYERFLARLEARIAYLESLLPAEEPEPEPEPTP